MPPSTFQYVPVLACLLAAVACYKPFPGAIRPPVPPPPPPMIVFLQRNEQTDRIQSQEMIAPNYVQQGQNRPSLSLGNTDFNIQGASGYRPQRPQPPRPQQPLRPQPQRPQPPRPQPQRPQQPLRPQPQPPRPQPPRPQPQRPQPQQPQRPQPQQPQPQRPQNPQNPFSRPIARPPVQYPQRPHIYQGDTFYYQYYTDQGIPYYSPNWSQ